ncbi:MAG TPA: asparagine synthase (glutamine-hydrolyzing) [Vicinamibacteria bacterium]|nr:asparagine synthase (glutamine-hydrolyzing) [Vicinamibacteria bacterium]
MCGIAGVVARDARRHVDPALIRRMVERLHHRGPDDTGLVTLPGVGLGLKRLSIIDVAGGRQPITNEDGSLTFVGNGEIFNFRSLGDELRLRGHRFRTGSDMETVVHGYEEWGDGVVARLKGQFAFALWDGPRRRLLAARDRAGEKPLYYYEGTHDIVFASELKSLLERADIPRRLDPQALDLFLTYEFIPSPYSIFEGVRKLPPAHAMSIEDGVVRTWAYWNAPAEATESRSEESWADELRETLGAAVRSQMMADVPLGAFLSGGIDSSAVVAFMSESSKRPVKTFSIAFRDASYDESAYAQLVAERFGTEHTVETIEPDVAGLFDQLVVHLDEPFADVSLFPTYLVSQLASRHVKVVLSGDGGDELFAGYDWYVADRIARNLARFPGQKSLGLLHQVSEWFPPSDKKKGLVNRAKRFLEGAVASPELQHYRWMSYLGPGEKRALYTKALKTSLGASDASDAVVSRLSEPRNDLLNRQLYADFKLFLADDILVKVDRMSMATSLEARAPFLDTDVLELAFRMPGSLKLRGSTRKYILKKALSNKLPGVVLRRRKEGFSIPMKNWLRDGLRPLMNDLLSRERVEARKLFRYEAVERLISEHVSSRANRAHQLFPLMVFERWASEFI